MKGAVIRAVVIAASLLIAAIMLIDWNAIYFAGGPQETYDAQLRGDPTIIMAEVSGLITAEPADDDMPVHRGQLLYVIEQDTYQAALDAATAVRDEAAASLALLQAERDRQKAAIDAARKTEQGERANLVFAREDAGRFNAIAGTPGDLLRARQSANADEARERDRVNADAHAVTMAEIALRQDDAQVESAKHDLAADEAALDLARINLRWTRVVAPEDGVITLRAAHPGQYVTAGTPLTRFVPLPRVWAVAWYREEQVHMMRVGLHARIHVDAFPGLTLHGCVQSLGPVAQSYSEAMPPDQSTGNFTKVVQRIPVKITFPTNWGPDQQVLARGLIPGLNVETYVDTGRPADCVPVPGE